MVMLERGKVLKIGDRKEFENLRDADPASLKSKDEKLMNQFLNGRTEGPLSDKEGLREFGQILINGEADTESSAAPTEKGMRKNAG
jgi:hypothetical protein